MGMRAFFLVVALSGCASAPTVRPTPRVDPETALARVGRGEGSLSGLVAAGEGLGYVLRREDASGEDPRAVQGVIAETRRLCAAGDPAFAELDRELALHYQPEFDYVPVRCEGLICRAAGPMEYATSLRLEFEERDGHLVLARLYRVEDVALEDEYAARRWVEAERAMAELPSGCP